MLARLKRVYTTGKYLVRHPLAGRDLGATLSRYVRWNIGARLVPGAVVVPFVEDSRLCTADGSSGALGNVYAGLQEFEEMAFTLHLLRPGDLFVDVGANIGSYTVLASKVCGARSLTFEPVGDTFAALRTNIQLNEIEQLVDARQHAISSKTGTVQFTTSLDAVNHVARLDSLAPTVEVEMITLDAIDLDAAPRLIKIDVEGHEGDVLDGATQVMTNESTMAVILELTNDSNHYGRSPAQNHAQMLGFGFRAYRYSAFDRVLTAIDGDWNRTALNTIYVRDIERVAQRLVDAPRRTILGVSL